MCYYCAYVCVGQKYTVIKLMYEIRKKGAFNNLQINNRQCLIVLNITTSNKHSLLSNVRNNNEHVLLLNVKNSNE